MKNSSTKEILECIDDYRPSNDIFSEEDERVSSAKTAFCKLDTDEKIIFLLYIELGNKRAVAERLNISKTAIYTKIKSIQEKIKINISKSND